MKGILQIQKHIQKGVTTLLEKRNAALLTILSVSFFFNFWNIDQEGLSNLYYTVTVKSMLTGFRNWFFAAYDPAGFVSVDKPPLSFWIQSLFVLFFGLRGWAIILPSALAGVLTVYFCYKMVACHWDARTGLIAACVAATTPVLVAVSRNNTPDAILLLFTTAAAHFLLRSIDTGMIRHLLVAFVLVALGFNTKFLMAFTILPAFVFTYVIFARTIRLRLRLTRLATAFAVMLVLSLAWVVVVDSTPKTERPYVGGSMNNSEADLLIGFNGIARVLPGHLLEKAKRRRSAEAATGPKGLVDASFFDFEMGSPGVLRLFNNRMIDQIWWYFPIMLIGTLVAAFHAYSPTEHKKRRFIFFCSIWLLPCAAIMSVTVRSHRYYLSFIAPPVASLVAVGYVSLWRLFKERSKVSCLLPVTLLAGFLYLILFIPDYQYPYTLLLNGFCAVGLVAAILLLVAQFLSDARRLQLSSTTMVIASFCLVGPPILWSFTPSLYGTHDNLPYAAPSLWRPPVELMSPDQKAFYNGMKKHKSYDQPDLARFLIDNHRDEQYLAAVPNALIASPLILRSNLPVMAMGGFVGRDAILTAETLGDLAESGKVSFFVTSTPFKMPSEIETWIKENCTMINVLEWRAKLPEHINSQRIDELFDEDFGRLLKKSLTVYRYKGDRDIRRRISAL